MVGGTVKSDLQGPNNTAVTVSASITTTDYSELAQVNDSSASCRSRLESGTSGMTAIR